MDVDNGSNSWKDSVFRSWGEIPFWRKGFKVVYPIYAESVQGDSESSDDNLAGLSLYIASFLRKCKEEGSSLTIDNRLLSYGRVTDVLRAFDPDLRHDFMESLAALMDDESNDRAIWTKKFDTFFDHPLFHMALEVESDPVLGNRDDSEGMKATTKSFSAPFIGKGRDNLWKYISKSRDKVFMRYENSCAIVQSSGMGKSRAVYELGEKCILISISLGPDDVGYPPPDKDLRDFLVFNTNDRRVARGRCFSVLRGLIQNTLTELGKANASSEEDLRKWFYEKMSWSKGKEDETAEYRRQFFQDVIEIAKNDEAVEKPSSEELEDSATDLVKFLDSKKSSRERSSRGRRRIVIAFDEAHALTRSGGIVRDVYGTERHWNTLITLREAFRACRRLPVWGLFVSTTGKFPQSDPPSVRDPSARIMSQKYFAVPPFTAMGYDVFAPGLTWDDSDRKMVVKQTQEDKMSAPPHKKSRIDATLTLKETSHVAFLVRFGRPMFALRYKLGGRETRRNILRFAVQKLICNDPIEVFRRDDQLKLSARLAIACLSQRICLEFDMSSYNSEEEKQIADHMRLCLGIGPDNQYIMSSSGSEPVLSEAAALIMMHRGFLPADNLKLAFDGFGISKDLHGETVAMLAVTVARDAIVRKNIIRRSEECGETELGDVLSGSVDEDRFEGGFRIVGVVHFLRKLFSIQEGEDDENMDKGKGGGKDKGEGGDGGREEDDEDENEDEDKGKGKGKGKGEEEVKVKGEGEVESTELERLDQGGLLSDAHLYFNHFIKPFEQPTCNLVCLMAYMTRGAALLCANNMPAVDFILPMLFGGTLLLAFMSFVLIQVKNDPSITFEGHGKDLFAAMNTTVCELFAKVEKPKPVVRIIFSLRSKKKLHYEWKEFNEGGKTYQSLDIWCGGISFYRKGEPEERWMGLASTTLKTAKDAESTIPGAASRETCWRWMENMSLSQE